MNLSGFRVRKPTGFWRKAIPVVYTILLVVSTVLLWRFENQPGEFSAPPSSWPEGSKISRQQKKLNLILFAHPKCSCTRASLEELALIMSRAHNQIEATVLFYLPSDYPEAWNKTDLWHKAGHIPGTIVRSDLGGKEAAKFKASTSGQTFLFDSSGKTLFVGGITPSRGHSGDNSGRSIILSAATQGINKNEIQKSFVFGCSLSSKKVQNED